MRASLVPATLLLLLLALVFLLPSRDNGSAISRFGLPGAASAGPDVAAALFSLPPLDLMEPPSWVIVRGGSDGMVRALDRLAWGTHAGMLAARAALEQQPAGLSAEILSRLRGLGDGDPILASKLVALLAVLEADPASIEELAYRALAPSALVARAALKVLARHPAPEALGPILDRRHDADLDVRSVARAALAERARRGDREARAYVLQDVEENLAAPDLAYLAVLGEVSADPSVLEVLRAVAERAPIEERLVALSALLVHGDEGATTVVERMLDGSDPETRLNALHMAAVAGRVLGRGSWERIATGRVRVECLLLMSILRQAFAIGDRDAPLAVELLEVMAGDPTHPCQVEAIDVLFQQGHPWAVERTRAELLDRGYVGEWLGRTIDRLERSGVGRNPDFAALAFERLADSAVAAAERTLLWRFVAQVEPQRAADLLVREALEAGSEGVPDLLTYLPRLGLPGLERLAHELDSDRGAGLYVFVAATLRSAEALPNLAAIAQDERRDPVLRWHALDAIVRLEGGPREEALRGVVAALNDPEVAQRVRLLFWNYL